MASTGFNFNTGTIGKGDARQVSITADPDNYESVKSHLNLLKARTKSLMKNEKMPAAKLKKPVRGPKP